MLGLSYGREAISMIRTIFQEIYQMKKLLQASTAIVGVAMIASSAHAALEISGTGRLMISMGGDAPGADTMQFDTEGYYVGFSGSKKTDSGLTLSGGAYLNDSKGFTDDSDNVNASWDKTSFAISGDFGKVEVTNKGDASNLSGTATYLEAAEYGFDALTPLLNEAGFGKTNIEVPRGTTRINYFSPNINGFSAGFSMMESGGDSTYDVKKEGPIGSSVDVVGTPGTRDGDGNLILVDTDTVAEGTVGDLDNPHQSAIALGVKYVSNFGLTFGYGNTTYSKSITVEGGTAAENGEYSTGWTGTRINLGYSVGAFSAGFTTTTQENDLEKRAGKEGVLRNGVFVTTGDNAKLADGDKAGNDSNNTVIALKYNYGAGSVSYLTKTEDVAKRKADGTTDLKATEDISASIISVSHTITPGVNAYLQSVSADYELDRSTKERDSASELILGLTVSF